MELGEKVNAGSDREADAMPLDGVECRRSMSMACGNLA
jgi:hypothetical protein